MFVRGKCLLQCKRPRRKCGEGGDTLRPDVATFRAGRRRNGARAAFDLHEDAAGCRVRQIGETPCARPQALLRPPWLPSLPLP